MPQRTAANGGRANRSRRASAAAPLADLRRLSHAAKNTLYIWALLGMVAILASVMVELRAAMAQVVRLTRTDPLTHVLNRRGFRESITQMVSTGRRLKSHGRYSWSTSTTSNA